VCSKGVILFNAATIDASLLLIIALSTLILASKHPPCVKNKT
jgi:hypothetical protein